MMYQKALLFMDFNIADKIMKTNNPEIHKELGRKVSEFNGLIWDNCKKHIVYNGLKAKFYQNLDLLKQLLVTKGTLVEANPYDAIWGIGLRETDREAQNRKTWRGQNLLGELLTKLKNEIKNH